MRKVILMMLLAVVSSGAMAEWEKIGSNDVSTLYADPDTVIKNDGKAKIWKLDDFRRAETRNGLEFLSKSSYIEIDCTEQKFRNLSTVVYSGHMRTGIQLYKGDFPDNYFVFIEPGSAGSLLFKYACRSTGDKLIDKARALMK